MQGLFSFLGRCLVMSSPVLVRYAITKFDPKEKAADYSLCVPQQATCCSSCKKEIPQE